MVQEKIHRGPNNKSSRDEKALFKVVLPPPAQTEVTAACIFICCSLMVFIKSTISSRNNTENGILVIE